METKSDSLLSKVASFFREMGNEEDAQASQKAARAAAEVSLKDRLKLKRHDDAIREREFKQLRKIIKTRRTAQGVTDLDPPRPSVASQISGFNASNRASTLQKINVAEAQLEQWWGGTSSSPLTTASAPLQTAAPSAQAPLSPEDDFDLDFTGLSPLSEAVPLEDPAPAAQHLAVQGQASVIEEHPVSHIEECVRDAAICYSEGEYNKAEDLLLTTLKGQRLDGSEIELLTFALFDVYRATGQQSHFEVTAMDYAERVGRSPAEWFSIPEKLAQQAAADKVPATPAPAPQASMNAAWQCPPTLNGIALAQLQIQMGNAGVCRINWSQVTHVDNLAAPTLAKMVQQWCTTPAKLEWTGVDALLRSLGLHTHQASPRESEIWWRTHMDVLCILGRSEDFENLALDYCVAFEVSPPNPTEVKCSLVEDILDLPLEFPILTNIATPSAPAAGAPLANASGVATCSLVGDITGDAAQAVQALRNASEKAQLLTVSCALLRRIDFTAANAIFNWTKTREGSGVQVHFTQVPRLVLIFLLMLGLEKHATLSMRNQ